MDHPRTTVARPGESGVALLVALLFTMVVTALTVTGTLLLRSHATKNRVAFATKSQALQVARSGLVEAANWLRRQTSQPVLTFAPKLDDTAVPPINDTIDPDIGLVREFKITGSVWARYEVWKQLPADPDPDRLAWRQQFECEDVSMARANASPGTVWRLRSIGYVYQQVDPDLPFDQLPNRVLASQVTVDEVRRLVIDLPGQAALNVGDGNSCHINTNGRVVGGAGAGIYYPAGTGTPTVGPPPPRVTGSPALATAVDYDDSVEAVFGMSFAQLQSLANLIVTDAADFPSPVPDMGLVVVDVPTLVLTSADPLLGTGIVVVRGNVTISQGSNSNFSGLLYVDGNLTVRAPCEINGSVVCTGNVTVQGVPDYATINFDEEVLNTLLTQLGNYRLASTTLLPRLAK